MITSDPALFEVLRVKPAAGALPQGRGVVLDHHTWTSMFHGDSKAVGSNVQVGGESYPVTAVLPASFRFVSRQPSIYVVHAVMSDRRAMVVARAKPGTGVDKLNRELTKIAENFSYYFFGSGLRLEFLETELFTPLRFFGVAVLVSAFILVMVCRVRLRMCDSRCGQSGGRRTLRRSLFFAKKVPWAGLGFCRRAGVEPV